MPIMDGKQALKHIQDEFRGMHPPVVAMTANSMEGALHDYLSLGFAGILSKPCTVSDLISQFQLLEAQMKAAPRLKHHRHSCSDDCQEGRGESL